MFRQITHPHQKNLAATLEEGRSTETCSTETKLIPHTPEPQRPTVETTPLIVVNENKEIEPRIPSLVYLVAISVAGVAALTFVDIAETVTGLNDSSAEGNKLLWSIEITPQNLPIIMPLICAGYGIQLIFTYAPFVKDGFETIYEIAFNRRYPDDEEEWPDIPPAIESRARKFSGFIALVAAGVNGMGSYFYSTDKTGLNWPKSAGIAIAITYTLADFAAEGVNCLKETRQLLGGPDHVYPEKLAPYAKYLNFAVKLPSIVLALGGSLIVICEDYVILTDPDINRLNLPHAVLFTVSIIPGISYYLFLQKINNMAGYAVAEEFSEKLTLQHALAFCLNVISSLFVATAISGFMSSSLKDFDLFELPESFVEGVTIAGVSSLATSVVYMSNKLFDYGVSALASGVNKVGSGIANCFSKIGSAFSNCRKKPVVEESVAQNPFAMFRQAATPTRVLENKSENTLKP